MCSIRREHTKCTIYLLGSPKPPFTIPISIGAFTKWSQGAKCQIYKGCDISFCFGDQHSKGFLEIRGMALKCSRPTCSIRKGWLICDSKSIVDGTVSHGFVATMKQMGVLSLTCAHLTPFHCSQQSMRLGFLKKLILLIIV